MSYKMKSDPEFKVQDAGVAIRIIAGMILDGEVVKLVGAVVKGERDVAIGRDGCHPFDTRCRRLQPSSHRMALRFYSLENRRQLVGRHLSLGDLGITRKDAQGK